MSGFRTGGAHPGGSGGPFRGGPPASAPFSHAQILHLMKTEFARARRYDYPVSCLLIEVDRMQQLADMHGTELRERVTVELSRLIVESTRCADQLGLVNDGRFLLVLPHIDADQAYSVGERLSAAFRDLEVKVGGSTLNLSLSMGAAACTGQDTLFFDTMLSRAEAALEWATHGGGDRIEVFRGELSE